jgi:hypothetical protein
MLACRTFLSPICALPLVLAARDPAFALDASEVFATGFQPLVIKVEGRKGTRLYRPDDSEGYDLPVEGKEKATATHEPTAEDRLEECMASWDEKTHIPKSSWRLICQRQIKDNE